MASAPPAYAVLLRQLRVAANLTQEELAARAGVAARTLSDIERGLRRKPYPATVRQLADALDLSPGDYAALQDAVREARRPGQSDVLGDAVEGNFLGATRLGQLIARTEEQARVDAALRDAAQGRGRLIAVCGEAGIGKTRLAQEAMLQARRYGFLIATGRCFEPQRLIPFHPFIEALTTLYEAAPDGSRAEIPTRWPHLTRLIPDHFPDAPLDGGSNEMLYRLFRSVSAFIRAIAEDRPVVLAMDDAHWADQTSLELLRHLARETARDRVLLIVTFRDVEVGRQHPLRNILHDLEREALAERLSLVPLAEKDTGELAAAAIGAEVALSDDLVSLVHRRTEGNPFFIQQVVRDLVERGGLYRQDVVWHLRAIEEIEAPESVRGVVRERVSRLLAETQASLHEASVLGQVFSFDDLLEMAGSTEEDLERALEEAMELGLVREADRDRYAFDHALTQGTLYADLSGRQRRRLHHAAGEALDRLPERIRRQRSGELARHFREGGDAARALRYALEACEETGRMGALTETEAHARAALQLARGLEDEDGEAAALMHLAGSIASMSRYEEALQMVSVAVRQAESRGNLPVLMRWLAGLARLYVSLGDLQRAREYAERSLQVAEQIGDPGWGHFHLGRVFLYRGDWPQARQHLEWILQSESSGPRLTYASHIELARLTVAEGRWEDAAHHLEQLPKEPD
jgi:predicted ATPase/DNA-binding XRE family transcriptional regulator